MLIFQASTNTPHQMNVHILLDRQDYTRRKRHKENIFLFQVWKKNSWMFKILSNQSLNLTENALSTSHFFPLPLMIMMMWKWQGLILQRVQRQCDMFCMSPVLVKYTLSGSLLVKIASRDANRPMNSSKSNMPKKTCNPTLIAKARSYNMATSFHRASFSFLEERHHFKGHQRPEKIHFPVDMRH